MTRKQTIAEHERLQAIFDEIRTGQRAADSRITRERVRWASAVLSAWVAKHDPPKRSGYASRAGQRQAKERTAHAGR